MKIAFNPSTVAALISPPNNNDITFDLRGRNIFARGVKFQGTDTNTWRSIQINGTSIGTNILNIIGATASTKDGITSIITRDTWRQIKINNISIGTNTLDLRNGTNVTLVNNNGIVTISSTWRPVVDNLTSTAKDQSLSANMGRYLKSLIDNKSNSDHNHDGRYVYNYGSSEISGSSLNNNALFMTTSSGITKDWWHILQAAWNNEYRWNSQIAFPTQNRNGVYYRSGLDDNTKWGAWVKLLDVDNYADVLDSRYYTESEINDKLNTKLDRVNLSTSSWNPRGYNLAADYYYNGGDVSFAESGGQMHISIDGKFWQNEGQYRVLDTSDLGSIYSNVSLNQYLSESDTAWYPIVWGGSVHRNTNNSTGQLYKSHDKLSWQTSSQTLYTTNLQTLGITFPNSGTFLRGIQGTVGDNDFWRIVGGATSSNNGYLEIATADDGTEPIYIRQYTGVFSSVKRTLTLLDDNGNTNIPGYIYRRSGGTTISGRDNAIIRQTYAPGDSSWNPIACVDTETGTWTLGHLSAGDNNTDFNFCFSTNTDYNTGTNNGNYVTLRNKFGTIALTSEIPDPTGYYWANMKVQSQSSTSTNPTFGMIAWGSWGDEWSDGTNKHPWYGYNNYHNTGVYSTTLSDYFGMSFRTANAIISLTNGGQVGINTYSPAYTLDVEGSFRTTGNHYYQFNSDATLRIYGSPYDTAVERVYIQAGIDNRLDDYDIASYGGEQRHSIVLNPRGGFVGIGNSNPAYKLEVGGNCRIASNLLVATTSNSCTLNIGGTSQFTDTMYLPSTGESYIANGGRNTSGADFSNANIVIRSWWGISFKSYDNVIRTYIDTRTGDIGTKGSFIGNLSGIASNAYHLYITGSNSWSSWYWYGQNGQPAWLWGSNDGTNMYVWNPSNFNVSTAQYLRSLGNRDCQIERNQNYGDLYTYNTYGNANAPSTYNSIIGFGRGTAGTVEIAGDWCNGNLSWRSLRDYCDNWYDWRTVIDTSNWSSYIPNANDYYWANVKISTSSNTQTQPSVNTIYANNWFRSQGSTGWYSEDYDGGWFMQDTSWIRAWNDKGVYTAGQIYSGSSLRGGNTYIGASNEIWCDYDLHIQHNGRGNHNVLMCCGGATGKVGIGTSSPNYKLDVSGDGRFFGDLYSYKLNHPSEGSHLIIGDNTKEISIRSKNQPGLDALYLNQKISTNVYYTANQGFGIRPYYLSSLYFGPNIIIQEKLYRLLDVGDAVSAISCIIADKVPVISGIRGVLIRFNPGDDGQIIMLKDLNNYGAGNGYFWVQPYNCNIVRSDNSNIYIANNAVSNAYDDGKSRFFIYAAQYNAWIEFYCG